MSHSGFSLMRLADLVKDRGMLRDDWSFLFHASEGHYTRVNPLLLEYNCKLLVMSLRESIKRGSGVNEVKTIFPSFLAHRFNLWLNDDSHDWDGEADECMIPWMVAIWINKQLNEANVKESTPVRRSITIENDGHVTPISSRKRRRNT